jgi:DNA polymerase-3 subunit delta
VSDIYILTGSDDYLKRKAADKIKDSAIKGDSSACDFESYSLADSDIKNIHESVNTAPFFAKKRIVLVRHFSDAPPYAQEFLAKTASSLPPYVILIIDAVKLPAKKILDIIKKSDPAILRCDSPKYRELSAWVQDRFSEENKKITQEANFLLQKTCSDNLESLRTEIEKIVTYAEKKILITKKDVEYLCGRDIEENIFELLSHIAKKDSEKALKVCGGLNINRKNIFELTGLVASNLRKIKKIIALKERGETLSRIKREMDLSDFAFSRLWEQAGKFTAPEAEKGLDQILEADYKFKSGRAKAEDTALMLVANLCLR